jgi:TctA family transporter
MMDSWHGILHGLMAAGTPTNLLYTLIGVFIGTMISHLPGIGPSAGIALLIPITFGMNPTTALIMLAALMVALSFWAKRKSAATLRAAQTQAPAQRVP